MTAIDPYRTLGLTPGASQAEIKRAYRHLAKLYHPDSAGDRALSRFLAIQAAYEALVDEHGRGRGYRRPGPATRPAPPPSAPWQADASRARATREANRARTRQAGPAPGPAPGRASRPTSADPSSPGARSPGGPRSTSGPAAGPAGQGTDRGPGDGSTPGSGAAGAPGSAGGRRRRSRGPKATIGSTSYDGADKEPFDPAWEGATWYGAGSGTYWTLNPKEYADPRKHGPEYLARSRRQALGSAGPGQEATGDRGGHDPSGPVPTGARPPGDVPPEPGPSVDPAVDPVGSSERPAAGAAPSPTARPVTSSPSPRARRDRATLDGSSAGGEPIPAPASSRAAAAGDVRWEESGSRATGAPATARVTSAGVAAMAARPVGSGTAPTFEPPSAAGLARAATTLPGRIALAIVGWIPFGIGLAAASEVLPACSGTSLVCADPLKAGIWPIHLLVIGLLVGLPRLALIAAYGTAAFLLVGLIATPVLIAIGGAQTPEGTAAVLRLALVAAWIGGIGLALSGRVDLPPWRGPRVR